MSLSSRPLVERERAALADLLEDSGPDAPTCCTGWTTAHLAAHVVVRDRRPDALPGYGVEQLGFGRPLSAWSHRLEDRLRSTTPFGDLVARVRSGAPVWSPMAWPPLAQAVDTVEFAVHHEDVRRARPGWSPRPLPRGDQDRLWGAVRLFARRHPGGLVLRRTDSPGVEHRVGRGTAALASEPLELLLWLTGRRDVACVDVS